MIPQEFYQSIGLTDEQIKAVKKALASENRYRRMLKNAGIHETAIDKIISKTDVIKAENINDKTLLEMIKEEWDAFIDGKRGELHE